MKLSRSLELDFLQNLKILLNSGIPILEAIKALKADNSNKTYVIFLDQLDNYITQGNSLAESLKKESTHSFNLITIELLRSAELSGNLDSVLEMLLEQRQKDIEFINQIKQALVYPFIIISVFFAVVLLLILYVLPQLANVFLSLGVNAPWHTKILFSISLFLESYIFIFLPVFMGIILVSLFGVLTQSDKLKKIFFNFPLVVKLGIDLDWQRFFSTMSILLKSGVPISQALELSQKIINNIQIKNKIKLITQEVEQGEALYTAFEKSQVDIPKKIIRIIQTGGISGKLDECLKISSNFYIQKLTQRLKLINQILEPGLILIIGVFVGLVILSVLGPVYQVINSLSVL